MPIASISVLILRGRTSKNRKGPFGDKKIRKVSHCRKKNGKERPFIFVRFGMLRLKIENERGAFSIT